MSASVDAPGPRASSLESRRAPRVHQRGWRRAVFKLAVSAAIVALLVTFVPWQKLRVPLARLPTSVFAAVLAVFLVAHALATFKWRMVVARAGARLAPRAALECYSAGLFSNVFLPSIVGGDVLRAVLAGRKSGRMEAAILGGAADRLVDCAALGALAVCGAFLLGLRQPGTGPLLTLAALLVFIALLAALPFVLRVPLSKWPRRVRRGVARALVALRRQARRPLVLTLSFVGALGVQLVFVGLNRELGRAIGIEAPWPAWLFAWPLAKVIALLPVGFNGIGVRDAAFATLFSPFIAVIAGGASALEERRALALASSFLWQGVLIAGGLGAGVAWWALARAPSRTMDERPALRG